MAETYNKKERTKKKLQKRKEKEQRRDEKRQESGNQQKSLDDMLAYVDENGNLSTTPPDPKKVQKIALEDIVIDTPKGSEVDPDAMLVGVVSYFDASKGYGFIVNEQTQERVFVHINQLADQQVSLSTGDKVEYKASKGPRGWQADIVHKR